MKKIVGSLIFLLTACENAPQEQPAVTTPQVQALLAVPDRPSKPDFEKFQEDEKRLQQSHEKNMQE